MSDKCHGAATPAEFRISTCSPSSMYNLSPQERGGLGLRCHNSICWMLPPQIRNMQSTRDETGQTLRWLTNGSSHLKLHNWVFLWHRDNALPIVEWAGNLLYSLVWEIFMEQRQLRHESIVLALLFSRAEIISFSTEFSSLTEVRQLLSEGPSLNSWQPPRNDNIFPNNPIGDPKLRPFRQRPKKGAWFDAIVHERSTIQVPL